MSRQGDFVSGPVQDRVGLAPRRATLAVNVVNYLVGYRQLLDAVWLANSTAERSSLSGVKETPVYIGEQCISVCMLIH